MSIKIWFAAILIATTIVNNSIWQITAKPVIPSEPIEPETKTDFDNVSLQPKETLKEPTVHSAPVIATADDHLEEVISTTTTTTTTTPPKPPKLQKNRKIAKKPKRKKTTTTVAPTTAQPEAVDLPAKTDSSVPMTTTPSALISNSEDVRELTPEVTATQQEVVEFNPVIPVDLPLSEVDPEIEKKLESNPEFVENIAVDLEITRESPPALPEVSIIEPQEPIQSNSEFALPQAPDSTPIEPEIPQFVPQEPEEEEKIIKETVEQVNPEILPEGFSEKFVEEPELFAEISPFLPAAQEEPEEMKSVILSETPVEHFLEEPKPIEILPEIPVVDNFPAIDENNHVAQFFSQLDASDTDMLPPTISPQASSFISGSPIDNESNSEDNKKTELLQEPLRAESIETVEASMDTTERNDSSSQIDTTEGPHVCPIAALQNKKPIEDEHPQAASMPTEGNSISKTSQVKEEIQDVVEEASEAGNDSFNSNSNDSVTEAESITTELPMFETTTQTLFVPNTPTPKELIHSMPFDHVAS